MTSNTRALYLSHGGGPLPLLGDPGHAEMLDCLRQITAKIDKPSAIIVISAHWESDVVAVTAAGAPSLIYDYYGFPPASYEITYPCPGHPTLARKIAVALESAHVAVEVDHERGLDHGVFVPLKIMYPEADIPVVQVSLHASLDPAIHLAVGSALSSALVHSDEPGLLLVGSGFSFHNMAAFFAAGTAASRADNEAFDTWLTETCGSPELSCDEREARLISWSAAPGARYCHPREEHLLPLHVCAGFTRRPCTYHASAEILGKVASFYLW